MRILLTGATGLIGREIGKALAARGDALVCLVRDPERDRPRLPFPAKCIAWDHRHEVPPEALEDVGAVVNLAGEPLADARWTDAKKTLIRDSRVEGTRRLAHAVLAHGAGVRAFVQASAIGYYGDCGDEHLDAASARGAGFLAELVEAWEGELGPLRAQRPDVRIPVVRTGIVLARQGGALAKMLPMFRLSLAGRLGNGRQWMSWIHIDDIVALFLHALDSAPPGILEGAAPCAVTNRDFTASFCRALGVCENLPVPALGIHALYGEMGGMVLESARVEPAATLRSGFRFRFDTVDSALDDLLAPLRGTTWEKASEIWVPSAPAAVWPYFRDERNLEELTPGFLHFAVLGKSTPEIGEGTLIDYTLRLEGMPFRWQTRIESWEPPNRFVDVQVRGPYALWRHTHEFVPLGGGTLLRDVVHWRPPAGWPGAALGGWKVESYVDRIFEYRRQRIAQRFGG